MFRTSAVPLAVAVAITSFAQPASCQTGEGFLFDAPRLVVNIDGGFAHANADSEVFGFVTDLLTLDRSDFDGFALGASVLMPITNRIAFELDGGFATGMSDSEFRDWVDLDDRPIEQRTEFTRAPVVVGARLYPLGTGRHVGNYAWLPNKFSPFLGAAVGGVWYRFRQTGDFVDFDDRGVFYDELDSNGWSLAAETSAGLEMALTPRLILTGEAAYLWANSDLDADFQDFDAIDLSGASATIGVAIRM